MKHIKLYEEFKLKEFKTAEDVEEYLRLRGYNGFRVNNDMSASFRDFVYDGSVDDILVHIKQVTGELTLEGCNDKILLQLSHLNPKSIYIRGGVYKDLEGLPRFKKKLTLKSVNILNHSLPSSLPEIIKGDISISDCNIKSLKNSPKKIYGDFDVTSCRLLETLIGGPEQIYGNYTCVSNNLKTLEGSPIRVEHTYNCSGNPIQNLKGAPKYVGVNFIASYCKELKDISGDLRNVGGKLDVRNCGLKTLKGDVVSVRNLNAEYNNLTSLEGVSLSVSGDVELNYNHIRHIGTEFLTPQNKNNIYINISNNKLVTIDTKIIPHIRSAKYNYLPLKNIANNHNFIGNFSYGCPINNDKDFLDCVSKNIVDNISKNLLKDFIEEFYILLQKHYPDIYNEVKKYDIDWIRDTSKNAEKHIDIMNL